MGTTAYHIKFSLQPLSVACFLVGIVSFLATVQPACAQYGNGPTVDPSLVPEQGTPPIDSAPPQRWAPLQGGVEEHTILKPPSPRRTLPGPPTPDPFLSQPDQGHNDPGAVSRPVPPGVPNLQALVQQFMALQGAQRGKYDVPPPVRPNWIPGYAFTNEYMVAPYHNLDLNWMDKRKMPDRPKWIKLGDSVTRFWRGFVPEPCMVLVSPMPDAPGNFTFKSPAHGGPYGWLEDCNATDHMGFPLYRYWFGR